MVHIGGHSSTVEFNCSGIDRQLAVVESWSLRFMVETRKSKRLQEKPAKSAMDITKSEQGQDSGAASESQEASVFVTNAIIYFNIMLYATCFHNHNRKR